MLFTLCSTIALFLPFTNTNQVTPPPQDQSQQEQMAVLAKNGSEAVKDEDENGLLSELFGNGKIQPAIVSPYQAMPVTPHTKKQLEYAAGNWATGNWFGARDYLGNNGVDFVVTYTSQMEGNPVGGVHPEGFAYVDNISLLCAIDTEKFCGWHGGHFVMSGMQQDGGWGESLSAKNIGNNMTVNGVVGGQVFRWVYLYLVQDFWKNKANFIIGRVCALDEFDVSPLYWLYLGAYSATPSNIQATSNPFTSWGSRLKVNVTKDSDLRYGIYQVTTTSLNGLTWNFYPNDSVSMFAQYTWYPEFGKPGTASIVEDIFNKKSSQTDKDTTSDKSFKAPVNVSQLKRLPGHYFIGGYYTTAGTLQYTSSTPAPYAYAFYLHGDQMVYRPNPLTDSGLVVWSAYSFAPEQNENIALLTFQAKGGAIYTGLIPGRPGDNTIFGVGYGSFSSCFASLMQQQGNGDPTYELQFELGYRINATRFFYVQPDIQFVTNPGGTGHIPDALILGTQIGITF